MSIMVFAQPTVPSGPTVPTIPNLTSTWYGWDGSVWPISKDAGLWFDAGIRGLGMPDITKFVRTPTSINGSVWYGYIIPEREVYWPLWSKFTEEKDRDFWHTMLPYQTGTWTVQTPSGQQRSLDLRITDDGSWAPAFNPFVYGAANYTITLAAEQPLWRSEPLFTYWTAPVSKLFFGGGDPTDPDAVQTAPPLYVSSSSSLNDAQITNAGDVEAWPIWVIEGPCTTATVGIGTDTITAPFTIASGQRLVIDTNPTVQTALLGTTDPNSDTGLTGTVTDETKNLTSVTWSNLPPGGVVDVSISVTGTPARVGVQYTPLYLRAW